MTPVSRCADENTVCREFEKLAGEQQPEKIIERYEASPAAAYDDAARRLIADAYLAAASQENISPEKEEQCYRKALELKHYIAYMGLYFFYAQKDEEKALGFLREYVKTGPQDTVPYVILGEAELMKNNYELSNTYLREGKKVAHAYSPRVDWLLFEANYLMKNYQFAKDMFESAVTRGKFDNEIRALLSDPRFSDIVKRPEFEKYKDLFKTTPSHS